MGKTKKKVVYNRGVSTVSVPAKKREEEPIEEVATENATTASGDTTVPAAASNGSAAATTSAGQDAVKVIEEWTPELAEKHQLQLLMDKIRAPSEKEVSRVSKVRRLDPYQSYSTLISRIAGHRLRTSTCEDDAGVPVGGNRSRQCSPVPSID